MSNSNTSSNISASCSLEVRHAGNLLYRIHLRMSKSVTFLLVNENIKCGIHFLSKIIMNILALNLL